MTTQQDMSPAACRRRHGYDTDVEIIEINGAEVRRIAEVYCRTHNYASRVVFGAWRRNGVNVAKRQEDAFNQAFAEVEKYCCECQRDHEPCEGYGKPTISPSTPNASA